MNPRVSELEGSPNVGTPKIAGDHKKSKSCNVQSLQFTPFCSPCLTDQHPPLTSAVGRFSVALPKRKTKSCTYLYIYMYGTYLYIYICMYICTQKYICTTYRWGHMFEAETSSGLWKTQVAGKSLLSRAQTSRLETGSPK